MGRPASRRMPVSLRKRSRPTDANSRFKQQYSALKTGAMKIKIHGADPRDNFDQMIKAKSLLRALVEGEEGNLEDKNKLITKLFTDLPKTIGFAQEDAERIYKKTLEESLLKESPVKMAFEAVAGGVGIDYELKLNGVEDFIKKAKIISKGLLDSVKESFRTGEVNYSKAELREKYVEAYALQLEGKKFRIHGLVTKGKEKRFSKALRSILVNVASLECAGYYGLPPNCSWEFSVAKTQDAKVTMEKILEIYGEEQRKQNEYLFDPNHEDHPKYVLIMHGMDYRAGHISTISDFEDVTFIGGKKQKVTGMVLEADMIKTGMGLIPSYRNQYLQDMTNFLRSNEFRENTGLDGLFFTWPYVDINEKQKKLLCIKPFTSIKQEQGDIVKILSL